MTTGLLNEHLGNYRALVARVDDLSARIMGRFSSEIACTGGCDSCCRHLTLFPVEAATLLTAFTNLPDHEQIRIRARAGRSLADSPCPLLDDHRCVLYDARPLICRTHGLPLLVTVKDARQIDCCPLNFTGTASLPGDAVIDLDRLNEALVAVNFCFISSPAGSLFRSAERVSIAEALLLGKNLL